MKFDYTISPNLQLITEIYCGYFKWDELIHHTISTHTDPLYQESYHVISDFSHAKVILNINDLDDYINEYQKYSSVIHKCAIIVSQSYNTSMAMLFEIQVRMQNAKVFHSYSEAYQWLKIDSELISKE